MRTVQLILKEIGFRKLNFALSLLGVLVAVLLFVSFFTASRALELETARVMRNMGLNLRIVPKETDMNRFWSTGFSDKTMPEAYVQKLASQKALNYSHLLPTLRQKVTWQGREVILVGIAPEVSPPGRRKPSMSFVLERGSALVGFDLARAEGMQTGSKIELGGRSFRVIKCLPESGTPQDVSILAHLEDVQEITSLEGRVNEIQALNCVCLTEGRDPLEVLREQLAAVLPEAKVIQKRPMADAREKQRRMIRKAFSVALPLVLAIAAAWIGTLALLNVRERWREIGILRALGYGSREISALFLGKALLVGLIGALIGFAAGTALALIYGPDVFKLTGQKIQPMYGLLVWSVVAAPLFAALSALIPTMVAVTQDPAVALRDQ